MHLPGYGLSGPGGKHPRLRGWQRLAAVDLGLVGEWRRRWPDANLALATGRRLDVLDLDGDQGMEALHAILSITPWEHPGPVARTGGAAGTCSMPQLGWATGSRSCPEWTGGGREWTAVAAAPKGSRNMTLNRAAFNLGQLVAAGLLDAEEVRAVLLAAAPEAGNPKAKAQATIASGLRGGAAKPQRSRRIGGAAWSVATSRHRARATGRLA